MTEWKVVGSNKSEDFIKRVNEHEALEYVLHPESFVFSQVAVGVATSTRQTYCALMSKK